MKIKMILGKVGEYSPVEEDKIGPPEAQRVRRDFHDHCFHPMLHHAVEHFLEIGEFGSRML